MRFLIDAQLPLQLSLWFRDHGHDSIHTSELKNGNRTQDKEIVQLCEAEERILITKDFDFLVSLYLHGTPKRIILVKTGNIKNESLMDIFIQNYSKISNILRSHSVMELTADRLTILR